jgi:hypothetical protein
MKACVAAGFIGVSRAAAITLSGAPARPFWKCISTVQCRLAASSALTSPNFERRRA